eukprot:tig00001408_g8617.t1
MGCEVSKEASAGSAQLATPPAHGTRPPHAAKADSNGVMQSLPVASSSSPARPAAAAAAAAANGSVKPTAANGVSGGTSNGAQNGTAYGAGRPFASAAPPVPKPAAAPAAAAAQKQRPMDSMSMASFAGAGGGARPSVDDYFGSLKPKPKPAGAAAALPAMIPGDEFTEGAGDPRLVVLRGRAMTLEYKVMVAAGEAARPALERLVEEVFSEVDATFNTWNPASEASRLNAAAGKAPLQLSRPLQQLLALCRELHKLTGGRFDPTVGPLRRAWLEKLERGVKPTPEEAATAAGLVGMAKLAVSEEGVATKAAPGVSLDLGAVAKGLAVDMLVERLGAAGFEDALVDWAGDMRAAGRHPAGRDWRTAVLCPPPLEALFDRWKGAGVAPGERRMLADVALRGRAAATSGDYQQLYKFGYYHVFDPRRGAAMKATATSVASATVLASSCALADALATAAMTFDSDTAARDFLERLRGQMPERVFGYVLYSRSSPAVLQAIAEPPAAPPAPPAGVRGDQLRELMRSVPLPVAVITAPGAGGAGPHAITANSVAVHAGEAPLASFNVARGSAMHALLSEPRPEPLPLALHFLAPDQGPLAARFAGPAGRQFEGLQHETDAETGAPLLRGPFATLVCRVERLLPGGDHALVLARVLSAERRPADPAAPSRPLARPRLPRPDAPRGPAGAPPRGPLSVADLAARVPRPHAELLPAGGPPRRPRRPSPTPSPSSPSTRPSSPSPSRRLPAAPPAPPPGPPSGCGCGGRGALAELSCRALAAHAAGDAALVVAEALALERPAPGPAARDATALLFYSGPDARPLPLALGTPSVA